MTKTVQVPRAPARFNQRGQPIQQVDDIPRVVIEKRENLMIHRSIETSALYSTLDKYIQEVNNRKQNKQVYANAAGLNLFNFQADYIIALHKTLADIDEVSQYTRMYETPKKHIFSVLDRVMNQVCEWGSKGCDTKRRTV